MRSLRTCAARLPLGEGLSCGTSSWFPCFPKAGYGSSALRCLSRGLAARGSALARGDTWDFSEGRTQRRAQGAQLRRQEKAPLLPIRSNPTPRRRSRTSGDRRRTDVNDSAQKSCSICGRSFPLSTFSYGNRENRSYCLECARREKQAYNRGGPGAAREFREALRSTWKR